MRIVVIGDVVGRSGREAVKKYMPKLRNELKADYIIVNVDNAAHGFGVTAKICQEFYDMGADCLTGGNHIWDQREMLAAISKHPRLLRPLNLPKETQGQGWRIDELPDGRKIMTVHALGRIFMDPIEDPFRTVAEVISANPMKSAVNAIIVDFHAETTSEKMAFGYHLDGKVSAVLGTHTHIPTADTRIFEKGTAYQTDIGMTGDYDSVIGVLKETPIKKFIKQIPGEKMAPATGAATLCAAFIETDDSTGLARAIHPIRLGPNIREEWTF